MKITKILSIILVIFMISGAGYASDFVDGETSEQGTASAVIVERILEITPIIDMDFAIVKKPASNAVFNLTLNSSSDSRTQIPAVNGVILSGAPFRAKLNIINGNPAQAFRINSNCTLTLAGTIYTITLKNFKYYAVNAAGQTQNINDGGTLTLDEYGEMRDFFVGADMTISNQIPGTYEGLLKVDFKSGFLVVKSIYMNAKLIITP